MTAYQFKPDLIYKINPAPEYPDGPEGRDKLNPEKREKYKKFLERFRNYSPIKTKLRERYLTGRLYAHLKHEEFK